MSKATLEKLPQSEGADYFIVLDPKEGIVHHTYTADLGRSFGHDHIKDAQERDSTTAHRWVVRPVFASPQVQDDKTARMKVAAALDCEGVNFSWPYLTGAIKELVKAERELVQLKSQTQADVRDALTPAARDVLAERARQISAEGWTPERDDQYVHGDLATAAGCYAMWTLAYPAGDPVHYWPWPKEWWKPSADRRRNRVKAAALLLAEIERIDRAANAAEKVNGRTPAHYLVDEHYPIETSERGAQAAQTDE